MHSSLFRIVNHTVPGQHIRNYARATLHEQEDVLQLAVKQYIPLNNPNPQPGDVTIIGAHANAFPKELYEPLWEDILARAKRHNFRIRSIWIADVAQQGQSGVVNEELLGNDPGWHDHSRDLLHLVNLKRDEMPRPIVGIGHSMGGNQLVNLSYMHPRLFTTLILIDPVIQQHSSVAADRGPNPAQLSTYRRDVWPSREAAAESYKSAKFYQKWDPRVMQRWINYGLRDLPTSIHHENTKRDGKPQVTLTTTKHQEVFTFLRPNYERVGSKENPENRKTHPDVNPSLPAIYPFYRPEPPMTFLRLPELRPSVLYVFGGQSEVGPPELCREKMESTGTGVGGSGGARAGRVKQVVFQDIGHLIAMEAVGRTADAAAQWLGVELDRWREDEEEFRKAWSAKTRDEKRMIDDEWRRHMGRPSGKPPPTSKPKANL